MARSAVDASLAKGELSYFHAFKDTRDWDYEPGAPALLVAAQDPLSPEHRQLLEAAADEAERGLAKIGEPDTLRYLADEWLRRRSFPLALAALQKALDATPKSGDVDDAVAKLLSRRSVARRGAGNAAGALEDAEQCVKNRKDWGYGHFLRSQALVALGRYEEAHKALRKAAALEGDGLARARILEAQAALGPHVAWGEDISAEKDGSALLRVVHRGAEARPFAEDLAHVRCHCRLHDQSEEGKRYDGSEPGRVRWSSYATQQGVAFEYTRDDPKKEPLEWVLGEDEPPFPLLDVVLRKLRAGGEAKVRLSSKGAFGRGLPVRGSCDAYIYLVNVEPACRGPSDQKEWTGLQSVSDEVARGAELLNRAAEALRSGAPGSELARLAGLAERRYGSAAAWAEKAWNVLDSADPDRAEALRLRALCGQAKAVLWKQEGVAAQAAGAAPSDVCATAAAAKGGADIKRAADLAGRAVELSRRQSAPALYVLGLALFASGDSKSAKAAFEETLKLEAGPATTSASDALVRLRGLEKSSQAAGAEAAAAKAKDKLEAGLKAKGGAAVEGALRELLAALAAGLPYEAAAALKLGKLAANVTKVPPSAGAGTAATELIAQLRKLAMAQGRS